MKKNPVLETNHGNHKTFYVVLALVMVFRIRREKCQQRTHFYARSQNFEKRPLASS
jgi:hypothetical protein